MSDRLDQLLGLKPPLPPETELSLFSADRLKLDWSDGLGADKLRELIRERDSYQKFNQDLGASYSKVIAHIEAKHALLVSNHAYLVKHRKDEFLSISTRPYQMGNLRLAAHDLVAAALGDQSEMLWTIEKNIGSMDNEYINNLVDLTRRSQKFDLRSLTEDDIYANADFADELEKADLLELPYPVTLYEWNLADGSTAAIIWLERLDAPAFGPFVRLHQSGWANWRCDELTRQARMILASGYRHSHVDQR